MTETLRLDNVGMTFRARKGLLRTQEVRAVDGVSLSLPAGETLALVGESGSGKTTLGRIALRLLRPTGGRVFFEGRDITDLEEGGLKGFRRRAQGIFQDPFTSLDPYMTVGDILEEPLIIHGLGSRQWRRGRVEDVLEEVRLTPPEDYVAKYPHLLSGGQRQRVGIARALLLDPVLLVADEPVSMIDASSRVEVLRVLRQLQDRRGVAILYITHDMATARHFAHRLSVMYLGRVVESGPAGRVLGKPLHPYTVGLVQSVPTPDPANRLRDRPVILGEPPSPAHIPAGCRFHPRCPSFMAGCCELADPPLAEADAEADGHAVACHLYPGVLPP